MINLHQRGNHQEHIEKQQAEAAVHQHFEESLKLAQQQRVSVSELYVIRLGYKHEKRMQNIKYVLNSYETHASTIKMKTKIR